jgi:hypothetical protein
MSVELRCDGKRCGKLLGHLHPSLDGPDGDPWIVLLWRGSAVCNHDSDPLASLDRRTVDAVLARAARSPKPRPYKVPTGTGRRAPLFPEWPLDIFDTPTGRVRVGVAPHDGVGRGFEYSYTPPEEPRTSV